MIYTAEITLAVNSGGTTATFYFSSGRFVTSGADTPANTAFYPRLIDAGSIGIHSYSDGKTGGATKLEIGEIVVANADGFLDGFKYYAVDGRSIVIRKGEETASYPSGFKTIFVGTGESLELYFDKLIFRLRDSSYLLEKPLLTVKYGGTNALPAGIDGTADDIKGQVIPKMYGSIFNAEPVLVNTSKLIYQITNNNFNTVSNVYDKGAALTFGVDRATNAAMQATAPAAGAYDTCKAEGLIRLGSTPAGLVTMDVYRGTTAANRTTAQTMSTIATNMGITAYAADVTALDTINSAVIGYYVNDERTALQAMDDVAASIGAFYYFDRLGQFRMGQLDDPTGMTPVYTFYDYEIIDIESVPSKDINIPNKNIKIDYLNNETVQTTDLAAAVTGARRAWLAKESRRVVENTTWASSTKYLLATEYARKTRLTTATDADNEALRLVAIYELMQRMYNVTINIDLFDFELMDCIAVNIPRYELAGGKNLLLTGYTINTAQNNVVLTLWG